MNKYSWVTQSRHTFNGLDTLFPVLWNGIFTDWQQYKFVSSTINYLDYLKKLLFMVMNIECDIILFVQCVNEWLDW